MVLLQLLVQDLELLIQVAAEAVVERKVVVVEIEQHTLLVVQEL
jgi:hypothetical protein